MKKNLGSFVVGDSTKCTGCKACEVACFTVHARQNNPMGKTVGTVTVPVTPKLYLTKFEQGCMPIQCKHCEDAPCLNVCTKGAISRIENQVIVDPEKCIGCKDCMQACPFGAIALLPYAKDGKLVAQAMGETKVFASKCDLCAGVEGGPACVRVCPHQALRLVDPEAEAEAKKVKAAEALLMTKNWR